MAVIKWKNLLGVEYLIHIEEERKSNFDLLFTVMYVGI